MADTEDTPCDVCRGTDGGKHAWYSLCSDCWFKLTALPGEKPEVASSDIARLPRKLGHSEWCALVQRRGKTCDCDWFELEGRPPSMPVLNTSVMNVVPEADEPVCTCLSSWGALCPKCHAGIGR